MTAPSIFEGGTRMDGSVGAAVRWPDSERKDLAILALATRTAAMIRARGFGWRHQRRGMTLAVVPAIPQNLGNATDH